MGKVRDSHDRTKERPGLVEVRLGLYELTYILHQF